VGKIIWSEKACKNLKAIFDYISIDSKIYASKYINSIIFATKKLESHPNIGRTVPEIIKGNFRELIHGNYRIVYRLSEISNDIEIIAVIHAARNMLKLLDNDEIV